MEQGTHSWKAFTELGMPPTSFPLLRVLSVETPRSCLCEGALIPHCDLLLRGEEEEESFLPLCWSSPVIFHLSVITASS